MFGSKTPKVTNVPSTSAQKIDDLPELGLAAIVSSKKQKDVGDFMAFFLGALERNAEWLNEIVQKQVNFRCALMVGAGPNRFQLQDIIYPTTEKDIKFEVELKDSEDYDKIAIAALMKLTNVEMEHLMKYLKYRLCDNIILKEDLQRGKAMGVNFAVLRPFSERQYRVMERIVIGSSVKCAVTPPKKRRKDEKTVKISLKKVKKLF